MSVVSQTMGGLMVAGGAATAGMALIVLRETWGGSSMPPLWYNDDTLRDFELLTAAEAQIVLGSFLFMVAGFYELPSLLEASVTPVLLFMVMMVYIMQRWWRRLK